MANMKPGDMLSIEGYDIVARAQCDLGNVLVLSNNSDHFLVVEQADPEDPRVRLHESFRYDGPFKGVYHIALTSMTRHALNNTDDSSEEF